MPSKRSPAPTWKTVRELLHPNPEEMKTGLGLFLHYRTCGYLPLTSKELLGHPDAVIAEFYSLLADVRKPASPVLRRRDSRWMMESDFCFINVRATGLHDTRGSFLQAAKLLPGIRANAIHLGPFTAYDFGTIYGVNSERTISDLVIDSFLAGKGLGAEAQLRMFIQAAHMLRKTVGFDLEPHVTQFARPVLMHPEFFRWIRVDPDDRGRLHGNVSVDDMMEEDSQQRIIGEVRNLAGTILQKRHVSDLEIGDVDAGELSQRKKEAYHAIIRTLIDCGYWTVPSHTWGGVGIPRFKGYDLKRNHPVFEYLTCDGRDQGDAAYGIVTPVKFYSNIPVNRQPDAARPPGLNREALRWFQSLIQWWCEEFGFDFIRHDSVDHIFDSLVDNRHDIPASDRPTPDVLAKCVQASKRHGKGRTGNLAERMGNEIEEYARAGYDLMLGTDMLEEIGQSHMEKSLSLQTRLHGLNRRHRLPFSVVYAVDTHDTGNPNLCGEPLITKEGFEGMRLRLFLSRFISCGMTRRPKYEVMGLNDLSHGLFKANIRDINLAWAGNGSFTSVYHAIENLYEEHRAFLRKASLLRSEIKEHYAWWLMGRGSTCLLAFVRYGSREDFPGAIVDLSFLGKRVRMGRILYSSPKGKGRVEIAESEVRIGKIPPRSCYLMSVGM